MQISTDSEAESSGQAKAGGPQTIAPDGGAEGWPSPRLF